MRYKTFAVFKYLVLSSFFGCAPIDVAKVHPGPVYCSVTSETYDLHSQIEDVVNEFNNQLGYEFFTNDPNVDILIFHMLPADAPWPVRSEDHRPIVALAYHNVVLIKYTSFVSTRYVHHLLVHEIGHSLGLPHNSDKNDVMYKDIDEDNLLGLKVAVAQVINKTNLRRK